MNDTPVSAGEKHIVTDEQKSTKWKPGQSGNPSGRRPGTSVITKLRTSIAQHVPEIVDQLVQAAKGGDVQAARLLLERVLPPVKATEQPQPIALPDGTLTEQGRAVLAAVSAGELAPSQGAQLLAAIGTLGKVAEVDELERRIKALEEANENDD